MKERYGRERANTVEKICETIWSLDYYKQPYEKAE